MNRLADTVVDDMKKAAWFYGERLPLKNREPNSLLLGCFVKAGDTTWLQP